MEIFHFVAKPHSRVDFGPNKPVIGILQAKTAIDPELVVIEPQELIGPNPVIDIHPALLNLQPRPQVQAPNPSPNIHDKFTRPRLSGFQCGQCQHAQHPRKYVVM